MTAAGKVLQRNSPENVDPCIGPHRGSPQLHVLAVDDSHVDRKVIERLLRSLSCEGTTISLIIRCIKTICIEINGGLTVDYSAFNLHSHDCGEWEQSSAVSGVGWGEEL